MGNENNAGRPWRRGDRERPKTRQNADRNNEIRKATASSLHGAHPGALETRLPDSVVTRTHFITLGNMTTSDCLLSYWRLRHPPCAHPSVAGSIGDSARDSGRLSGGSDSQRRTSGNGRALPPQRDSKPVSKRGQTLPTVRSTVVYCSEREPNLDYQLL